MRAAWWWIDRYRQSSSYKDFTPEQRGMYRDLLDEVWLRENYVIPDDDRILGLIVGDPIRWVDNKNVILAKFRRVDGGWTHDVALEVINQSERRADNQRRYRERSNNGSDNGADNGSDNKPDSKSKSKSKSISMSMSKSPKKPPIVPLKKGGRKKRGGEDISPDEYTEKYGHLTKTKLTAEDLEGVNDETNTDSD